MKKFLKVFVLTFLAFSCAKGPSSISINPKEVAIPVQGGSAMVSVRCDGNWSLSVTDDWVRVAPKSGIGNATVSIVADSNVGGELRTARVIFTAGSLEPATVSVSQTGEGSIPEEIVSPDPTSGISVEPEIPDADQPCTIRFRPSAGNPLYNHSGELYAHLGVVVEGEWMFVPCDWAVSDEKVHFKKVAENSWELKLEPSIREYFASGETPVKMMAMIVRSEDGETKSHPNDQFCTVTDNRYDFEDFTPDEIVYEALPSGVEYGININGDNSVTLVLYDQDKNGACHDYCYVVGDWNGWERVPEGAMKRDKSAGCWWTTVSGLDPGTEYRFQYRLGTPSGSDIRISDPYTEIVYDQWNDQYLEGVREFPEGAKALVSAFCMERPEYSWKNDSFKIEDKNDLVIYELLLRDFSETRDLAGARAQLDYLQQLGINAIELMPVQEFDGNLSWGYNPNHYFALDKAYGTREEYKEFIDECHGRGIAVLIDVVYNHLTGNSPWAKMYWDASANTTSASNPWFNAVATHPFSVFHDLNHDNKMVRETVRKSLAYLLEEYHVDGFRFDLSKGLTQKNSGSDVSAWGAYDQSRINILTDYYNTVHSTDPDAVMILEHFADASEEKVLAEAGMKLWRNMNGEYKSAMAGGSGNFGGVYSNAPFGGFVGYMESHDEQRICFGNTGSSGETSVSWGICGTLTDWGKSADLSMTADGVFFVARNVTFAATDQFKIRGNSTWDDAYNYGSSSDGQKMTLNTEFKLVLGSSSKNLAAPAAGTYDVYFCPQTRSAWMMTPGQRPSEPELGSSDDALTQAMYRAGCCAACFLTVPGPKMIWQFGEIGYDISGGNGDTSEKPVKTAEYLAQPARKTLYDTYAYLLNFRRENPRFYDSDASFSWTPSGNVKTITGSVDGKTFFVAANFGSAASCSLPGGDWKEWKGSNTYSGTLNLSANQFKLLVNF